MVELYYRANVRPRQSLTSTRSFAIFDGIRQGPELSNIFFKFNIFMIYVCIAKSYYLYIDVVTTLKKVSNLVVDTTISVRSKEIHASK